MSHKKVPKIRIASLNQSSLSKKGNKDAGDCDCEDDDCGVQCEIPCDCDPECSCDSEPPCNCHPYSCGCDHHKGEQQKIKKGKSGSRTFFKIARGKGKK